MKRFFLISLIVCMLLPTLAYCEEIDFSAMDTPQIFSTINAANAELANRGNVVKVDIGEYVVGEDILAGKYTLATYSSEDSVYSDPWVVYVFEGNDSLNDYKAAFSDYNKAFDEYYGGNRDGVERPERPREEDYCAVYNVPTNGSIRLSVDDGEIILFEVNEVGTILMISKTEPIFMD